jgi:hypothetical protein
VEVAAMAGLVEFAIQAVDGTKVMADANGSATKKGVVLEKLLSLVADEISELERQNKEDNGRTAYKLPAEYQNAERLRNKIGEALDQIRAGEGRTTANLTDPDARTMKAWSGFVTGYNAQAVVSGLRHKDSDAGSLLITAADVCTDTVDFEQLLPMMEQAQENTGVKDSTTLADSGYWSGKNLEQARLRGQTVIIPDPTTTAQSPYHRSKFVYDPDTDCYKCPEGHVLTFRGMTTNRGVEEREGGMDSAGNGLQSALHLADVDPHDARESRQISVGINLTGSSGL